MGLGSLRTVTLSLARVEAEACRNQLRNAIDPIEARKARLLEQKLNVAKAITFDECAARYIEAHSVGWRNAKHASQWENTLKTYASPKFGKLSVAAIDTGLVMRCLQPIWTEKPETASRLRGRIENILDWATVHGYRKGDNPARWKGHLENLLAKRSKVAPVKHHPALPYREISRFMLDLHKQEGVAARALEFLILTATRTSEVLGTQWDEIDLDAELWTIPPERMKSGREHRVPLSRRTQQILEEMKAIRQGDYVFPGGREGRSLSSMALLALLRRMGRSDLTVHGFRSTFRDWAAEMTAYPREVAEMALAHTVGDKVEAAYRRGDLFEKRRRIMADWAKFCTIPAPSGAVVLLKKPSS